MQLTIEINSLEEAEALQEWLLAPEDWHTWTHFEACQLIHDRLFAESQKILKIFQDLQDAQTK